MAAVAASQVSCPEVEALKARPSLRVSMATLGELQLLCDFSTGLPRPLLPPAFRMAAFTAVHSLAHPGIIATQRLMSTRWLWAGMAVDTPRWCRDCQRCQRAKVTKQPRATLQPMVILALRFSHLHLDLVGPLLRSAEGCNHILTIVDRSSRWLEAIHSTLQHHHSDSGHCQRFRGWLGSQIWRSGAHHLRQGSAVLFRCVGTAHTTPRLSSPSHHSLPYPGQRHGRKMPPPTQGRSPCPHHRRRLVISSSVGPAGTSGCPQGGLRHFVC